MPAQAIPSIVATSTYLTHQAFQVCDPQWRCRITEGVAGICWTGWAPDSRHILTLTDFSLALTIWPLSKPGTS